MLRVGLVGELWVELGERKLEPIASRRARSLLAWLAYHPGLHPRGLVAAVFWPNVLDASARASLRTTLATLRRELGEAGAGHIVAERDRVGIVEGSEVSVDLREAERVAAEGRLSDALELRDGELLTDLDDDWVLEERRVHRDRLGEFWWRRGRRRGGRDAEVAVGYARRRLEWSGVGGRGPRADAAARRAGDRGAAVAAYEASAWHCGRGSAWRPRPDACSGRGVTTDPDPKGRRRALCRCRRAHAHRTRAAGGRRERSRSCAPFGTRERGRSRRRDARR